MNPSVSKIRIYPVKSLDPVELNEVVIGKRSLLLDREYAIIKNDGKFVSGKYTSKVNTLRSVFDLSDHTITLSKSENGSAETFSLSGNTDALNKYLSDYFEFPVIFIQNKSGRFQDVPDLGGITIVCEASLSAIKDHYSDITLDEIRNRFRANIEISNCEAFWEDKLFDKPEDVIEFEINNVTLFGISPRERCIVPTRDSRTGDSYHAFAKKLAHARKESLPEWSALADYSHYYYLCTDVFITDSETGKMIKLGDELKIKGKKELSHLNI